MIKEFSGREKLLAFGGFHESIVYRSWTAKCVSSGIGGERENHNDNEQDNSVDIVRQELRVSISAFVRAKSHLQQYIP